MGRISLKFKSRIKHVIENEFVRKRYGSYREMPKRQLEFVTSIYNFIDMAGQLNDDACIDHQEFAEELLQRVDQSWTWLAFTAERQLYLVVKDVIVELNPALVDRRQNASAFLQVEKLKDEVNRLRNQTLVKMLETQITTLNEENQAKDQSIRILQNENQIQERALISLRNENASLKLIVIQLRHSRGNNILDSLEQEPIINDDKRNQTIANQSSKLRLACVGSTSS